MKKLVGVIGCGNMGTAIIAQASRLKSFGFLVYEKDAARQSAICKKYRLKSVSTIAELAKKSDIIIIAVKPQDIEPVLSDIRDLISQRGKNKPLIISIAAGIKTVFLEEKIGVPVKVIRVMPNMPAAIGKGMSALTPGRFTVRQDMKNAEAIFKSVGETVIVNEERIDAVTALSGSGPAYFYLIFSGFVDAACKLGLDKSDAEKLLLHTITGSMSFLETQKFDTEGLIAKVASKGGTTEAALRVFHDKGLKEILSQGLMASYNRSKELSR
ncbi:MAG: pyrroline-5-carboxylate reductase [Candidatus Omnitrophica bacterium]|nr:pyrroline-5-carboxylate reductase [Candidatus Omnitrophota bacterium]